MNRLNSTIRHVAEGSPGDEAGLLPGDYLVSINGRPMLDILQSRFESAQEQVTLEFLRDGCKFTCAVAKDAYEDLGIEFVEELFDGVHTCRNSCIFCFLRQMPRGLRPTLYVRDDDYRLSFTQGNYITLTNLSDEEMDRICSQKMTPLYISVHTTDGALRAKMLGQPRAARIMEQLNRLAESRISFHTQIVLCPGVNDGAHLERTVNDLAALHPATESIAVVPVGLTKHRDGLYPLRPVDAESSREAIGLCLRKQKEFKARFGTRLLFPSDELYLRADQPIPSAAAYEGYPQLEDGIGVSRIFLDELARLSRGRKGAPRIWNGRGAPRQGSYVLVTGTLARPMIEQLADWLSTHPGVSARVCEVMNDFLGETVTVAGLMAGVDVIRALAGVRPDEEVLIPSVALNDDNRFLDDVPLGAVQAAVRVSVTVVSPSPNAVWKHITRREQSARDSVSCAEAVGR